MSQAYIKGRALLPHQKKEIIQQLQTAWLDNPHLRLGELIVDMMIDFENKNSDLYTIEDFDLLELIRKLNRQKQEPIYPQITIKITK